MTRLRVTGLRARLVLTTVVGSVLVLGALVAGFNLVLDSRLRRDADNLLRERAAAQLQTLSVVDGRLHVADAPDTAAQDTRTWIFAGGVPVERPGGDPRNQQAALALIARAPRFQTVDATDTRFDAVPVIQGRRRLGTLVVAASLSPYENTARTALVGSLILGMVTVLAITAASWWIIRRALAPVARMTAKAADWGEHDLSRRFYAGEPHDEVSALAATFDQLLERLSQSLKREQRFTGEISHELRTPLAKIIAEAELAASRERTPEAYREALDSIRFAAEQLHGALDALLVAARTSAPSTASAIDARMIAERVAQAGRDALDGDAVQVQVRGSGAAVRVGTEPDVIERALAPIVDNAIRHARHRVGIGVRTEHGQLLFDIRDDGLGVPPEIRQRIFEPGVSLRSATNGAGSGAGLGLPLARRLARVAGGDVECQSSSTGGAFQVRFPLL
jgi:two-component system, OmpR family, sensor kinase